MDEFWYPELSPEEREVRRLRRAYEENLALEQGLRSFIFTERLDDKLTDDLKAFYRVNELLFYKQNELIKELREAVKKRDESQ